MKLQDDVDRGSNLAISSPLDAKSLDRDLTNVAQVAKHCHLPLWKFLAFLNTDGCFAEQLLTNAAKVFDDKAAAAKVNTPLIFFIDNYELHVLSRMIHVLLVPMFLSMKPKEDGMLNFSL